MLDRREILFGLLSRTALSATARKSGAAPGKRPNVITIVLGRASVRTNTQGSWQPWNLLGSRGYFRGASFQRE